MRALFLAIAICLSTVHLYAEDATIQASPDLIALPDPRVDGGKPLIC